MGGCTALIYPTSMKVLGSWVKEPEKRREILCILLGVLCLAVALPHLIRYAVPFSNFRTLMIITSSLTLFASVLAFRILRAGEYLSQPKSSQSQFDRRRPRFCGNLDSFYLPLRNADTTGNSLRFGLRSRNTLSTSPTETPSTPRIVAFVCIAVGMLGCFLTSQVAKHVEAEHTLIVINLCSMIFVGSLGAVHGAQESNLSVAIAILIGFVVVSTLRCTARS